jgi:hypothetical protein
MKILKLLAPIVLIAGFFVALEVFYGSHQGFVKTDLVEIFDINDDNTRSDTSVVATKYKIEIGQENKERYRERGKEEFRLPTTEGRLKQPTKDDEVLLGAVLVNPIHTLGDSVVYEWALKVSTYPYPFGWEIAVLVENALNEYYENENPY